MKLSWPKTLVKKWFNIKSKTEDFHADDDVGHGGDSFVFLSILPLHYTNLIFGSSIGNLSFCMKKNVEFFSINFMQLISSSITVSLLLLMGSTLCICCSRSVFCFLLLTDIQKALDVDKIILIQFLFSFLFLKKKKFVLNIWY